MNNIDDSLTTTEEEILIYENVEKIFQNQSKINNIKNEMILNEKEGLGLIINNLEKELNKNDSIIKKYNNEIENIKKNYKKNFLKQNLKLKKIEKDIKDLNIKLKNIINNKNNDIYKLTYSRIEEIFEKKKNLEILKNINNEINNNINNEILLENNNKKFNEKKIFYKENLNMIEEENNLMNIHTNNLISKKETIEEIINIFFNKINNPKNNNINFNFEIYHYELSNINIYNCSENISNKIINYLTNFYDENNFNNNENNFELDFNDKSFIIKNLNLIHTEIKNILLKQFANFINEKSNLFTSYMMKNFLLNCSKKILNIFSLNNINIDSNIFNKENLSNFIKLNIKLDYLGNILENNLNYLNKNLKTSQKIFSKKLYDLSLIKFEEKKNLLNKKINDLNDKKKIIEKNLLNSSPSQKEYIYLSEKSNKLLNEKKLLENDSENKKNNLDYEINKINEKISELKNKNFNLETEINELKKKFNNENFNKNFEIEKYEKKIEKYYKNINNLILKYKKKYGTNFNLYDKLNDDINKKLNFNKYNTNTINTNNSLLFTLK